MDNQLDDIMIEKIKKNASSSSTIKKKRKMRKRHSNKEGGTIISNSHIKASSLREKTNNRSSLENQPKYNSMRGSDEKERKTIIRRPRSISLPPKKFHFSKEKAEKISQMLMEAREKMPKVIESIKRMEEYNRSQRHMIEKLQITNSNFREIIIKLKDSMMVELQINDRLHKKLSILRKVNEEMNLIKKPSKTDISDLVTQDSILSPTVCVTCKWRKINVVLLPCSHFIICEICASSLPRFHDSKSRCCPVCKTNVVAVVKCNLDSEKFCSSSSGSQDSQEKMPFSFFENF
eukprot:TRINITY_DN2724_c0_g1_i1.p1 TRINITY_DN2724_c0_g1~~TRINITY_DN2724_c0_g1_i1.p1  ORF type:complete len:291 (+),score=75.53 TRINITY_DN2724_c0_g1_i1:190-1062(+)